VNVPVPLSYLQLVLNISSLLSECIVFGTVPGAYSLISITPTNPAGPKSAGKLKSKGIVEDGWMTGNVVDNRLASACSTLLHGCGARHRLPEFGGSIVIISLEICVIMKIWIDVSVLESEIGIDVSAVDISVGEGGS
jgi:hypothetical protein